MTARPERHTARVPSRGGQVRLRSAVSAAEAGAYDIRVTVYSSGRLVRALPLSVMVDEAPPAGR
ncbi:hypothetical protein SUDANB176_07286 [Streptomyces sp. enrichment culture]